MRVIGARTWAVALLLGVGAVGVRAWQGLHRAPSTAAHSPSLPVLVAFAAIEAAAAIAVVAGIAMLWRRPRRRPDERRIVVEPPAGRWARPAGLAFALVVLAIPLTLLVALPHGASSRNHPGSSYGRAPTPPRRDTFTSASPVPVMVTALAAGTAVLLVVRSRRPAASGGAPAPEPRHPLVPAVAAGERALDEAGTPRSAVIACYAAMEHALARSGAAPADTDTPADVLDRAASAGLVRSGAAATLTHLFREARYSLHPMGEEHRHAARTALARLRDDLEAAS